MHLPNFNQEIVIKTNAGIDVVVLMQADTLLHFFSKNLGPNLRASSVYIKELHVSTESVLKWCQYLLGQFFVFGTDHKSIREPQLLHQVFQTPDQQTYVRKLLGFHFRIKSKRGSSNHVADAFSRVPTATDSMDSNLPQALLALMSSLTFNFLDQLHQDNLTNPYMLDLHEQHKLGTLT